MKKHRCPLALLVKKTKKIFTTGKRMASIRKMIAVDIESFETPKLAVGRRLLKIHVHAQQSEAW